MKEFWGGVNWDEMVRDWCRLCGLLEPASIQVECEPVYSRLGEFLLASKWLVWRGFCLVVLFSHRVFEEPCIVVYSNRNFPPRVCFPWPFFFFLHANNTYEQNNAAAPAEWPWIRAVGQGLVFINVRTCAHINCGGTCNQKATGNEGNPRRRKKKTRKKRTRTDAEKCQSTLPLAMLNFGQRALCPACIKPPSTFASLSLSLSLSLCLSLPRMDTLIIYQLQRWVVYLLVGTDYNTYSVTARGHVTYI